MSESSEARPAILYIVPLYRQHMTNLCWAFCRIMLDEYRHKPDGAFLTQREAMKKARDMAAASYKGRNPLRRRNHLGSTPSADAGPVTTVDELYDLLKLHGPLYAIFGMRFGKHSIVVTGADPAAGTVSFNDPHGRQKTQSFPDFVRGKGMSLFFRYRLLKIRIPPEGSVI
ncbi:MAG: hypothetical protein MJ192_03495 [Clostridia bacterium]|nr:hypothetical protein [Clostridia bacterium]